MNLQSGLSGDAPARACEGVIVHSLGLLLGLRECVVSDLASGGLFV